MKKGRDLLQTIGRRSYLTLHSLTPRMDPSQRYCYNPTLHWNPHVEEYFIKAYGADHFSRISKALTCPSCYSCIRVNTIKTTSDAVIEKLLRTLPKTGLRDAIDSMHKCKSDANVKVNNMLQKQKSLVEESNIPKNFDDCSNAALEFSKSEDALKAGLQNGDISKCQLPGLDYVVFVRGSGPHAIEYNYAQDRNPKEPKEVIVSRKCAEAVLRGAQVYVPGVLACSGHVEKGDVVAVSVAVEQPGPDGGWGIGITRGTVLQGLQTDPYYFERNGLYIGQGTTLMSRAGIFRVSEGIALDMKNRVFQLPSFHDAQQGERILDLCAAPGGKTTAIAILMGDKGEVVAVDRSHNKVLNIQKLAAEMGLNCITTYKLDALKAVRRRNELNDMNTLCCSEDTVGPIFQNSDYMRLQRDKMSSIPGEGLGTDLSCKENFSNEQEKQRTYASNADLRKNIRKIRNGPGRNHCAGGRVGKSEGFSPNSFDRVLLDAPCSALGLRPRLFAGEETIESLRNHAKYQRRMFDQAVHLVRPGGVLVYSTCTINPGENEALVRYALDTYKFLTLASQHPRIGGPGLVGGCEFSDGYTEEWLRPGEEDLVQRFDPSSVLDTIGFFIAKFSVGLKDT
ncbi:rRNA (cytosine-C(5))-methyltransferase NOP2C isoform X2 [Cornus florida]|uniref:rRNA (cytosine-C(5))-methyltransferase NOP2C isoform X2 n=1 Tax=Cornus florida TaxID=4283 RepID=UPI0028A0D9B4|nr:rRNA (cytosine-C(5))-methyltransferase NOP2C isoform X2 [Cornus florida]